jgi:hypothetical protein
MNDNNLIISVEDDLNTDSGADLVTVKYGVFKSCPGCKKTFVVFLLFVLNLLNYMDRYTVAGRC